MRALIVLFLGGLFNFIRGGGHGHIRKRIEKLIGIERDQQNEIVGDLTPFQLVIDRLMDGKTINALAFGLTLFYLTPLNWIMALRGSAGMFAGQAMGWGDYIGAMGGILGNWRRDNLKENWLIDVPIKPLRRWPRIWGFVGLTLRGFVWGFCISVALGWNWWMVAAGGLLAPVYYIGTSIHQKIVGYPNPPWWPNEIAFGAILWYAVFYLYV